MANEQNQSNNNTAQAQARPAQQATPAASTRMFRFRVNKSAGLHGAFNGTCMVFEGDEFTAIRPPILVKGKNGAPDGLVDRVAPPWADVVEEYEVPKPPKVIRKADAPKP